MCVPPGTVQLLWPYNIPSSHGPMHMVSGSSHMHVVGVYHFQLMQAAVYPPTSPHPPAHTVAPLAMVSIGFNLNLQNSLCIPHRLQCRLHRQLQKMLVCCYNYTHGNHMLLSVSIYYYTLPSRSVTVHHTLHTLQSLQILHINISTLYRTIYITFKIIF